MKPFMSTDLSKVSAETSAPGYTLDRVYAALCGRFDPAALSDDEKLIFDDLLGEAFDIIQTAEEAAFWKSFEGQPNTDR